VEFVIALWRLSVQGIILGSRKRSPERKTIKPCVVFALHCGFLTDIQSTFPHYKLEKLPMANRAFQEQFPGWTQRDEFTVDESSIAPDNNNDFRENPQPQVQSENILGSFPVEYIQAPEMWTFGTGTGLGECVGFTLILLALNIH